MGKTGKEGRNGKRRMTERGRIEGKWKEEREACRKYDRRREKKKAGPAVGSINAKMEGTKKGWNKGRVERRKKG